MIVYGLPATDSPGARVQLALPVTVTEPAVSPFTKPLYIQENAGSLAPSRLRSATAFTFRVALLTTCDTLFALPWKPFPVVVPL